MEHYHMLDYIHESPFALEKTLKEKEAAIRAIAQKAKGMKVDKVVCPAWAVPTPPV
jgi:chloramphenicol 3-O-phosphotransferase